MINPASNHTTTFFKVADCIPVVSTFTNSYILFKKTIHQDEAKNPSLENRTFTYIKEKNTANCIALLFPFIGQVIVLCKNLVNFFSKKEPSHESMPDKKPSSTSFAPSPKKAEATPQEEKPSEANVEGKKLLAGNENRKIMISRPDGSLESYSYKELYEKAEQGDVEAFSVLDKPDDKNPRLDALRVQFYQPLFENNQETTWQCIELGDMYAEGRGGLTADAQKAISFYQKAEARAASDHAVIQHGAGYIELGEIYETGKGTVPADDKKAVSLYKKAEEVALVANNGESNEEALTHLIKLFRSGRGGITEAEGNAFILKFHQQFGSKIELGKIYENGLYGVAKNDVEAAKCYKLAAGTRSVDPLPYLKLCQLHKKKQDGLTDEEVEEIHTNYKNNPISNGSIEALLPAGCFRIAHGRYEEAIRELYPAAEFLNNQEAMCWIAFMYEKGLGLSKDEEEAAKWYRKAVETGVPNEKSKRIMQIIPATLLSEFEVAMKAGLEEARKPTS
jgi:TPR repeat protein